MKDMCQTIIFKQHMMLNTHSTDKPKDLFSASRVSEAKAQEAPI